MDQDSFSFLLKEVKGESAFQISDERCSSLKGHLGFTDNSVVKGFLLTLEFFYDRVRDFGGATEEPTKALEFFLERTGIDKLLGKDEESRKFGFDRLLEIVEKNPFVENQHKRKWLRTGLLDNAISFASFIDLRPNFNEERSLVQEYIPIVIFNIELEPPLGEDKSFVFQLSENALGKLKEALNDVEKKLATLRKDEKLSDVISFENKINHEE